jgi:hypothetical protein
MITTPGTDKALQQLLDHGGIDVPSARKWLTEALACLEEPRDGFSVGNASNQAAKAMVALGYPNAWRDSGGEQ